MQSLIWKDNKAVLTTELQDVQGVIEQPEVTIWIDVFKPTKSQMQELQDIFGFHDLAIADCIDDTNNKPRIIDHQDHCFIILQGVQAVEDGDITVGELNVFLGANFIVTVHHLKLDILERAWDSALRQHDVLSKGSDYVLYTLVSGLTEIYFDIIERLDDRIDALEDTIFTDPDQAVLSEIFQIKHQLVHLRRVAGPQREVFAMLNHREYPYIDQETLVYFRDVYEHLIRIHESIDSLRDLTSGTLDAYVSMTSNRMNQVMKTLTVIATIFMPLTFIGSIYGMNFKYLPELQWRYGYFGCLALMGALALWMVAVFRRKKWF